MWSGFRFTTLRGGENSTGTMGIFAPALTPLFPYSSARVAKVTVCIPAPRGSRNQSRYTITSGVLVACDKGCYQAHIGSATSIIIHANCGWAAHPGFTKARRNSASASDEKLRTAKHRFSERAPAPDYFIAMLENRNVGPGPLPHTTWSSRHIASSKGKSLA